MPENLQTTASAAGITHRFIGKPGAVVAFATVGGMLLLWPGCILGWIILQKFALEFNSSAITEIDAALLSGGDRQQDNGSLSRLVRDQLPSKPGICETRSFTQRRRVQVGREENQTLTLYEVNQPVSQDIHLDEIGKREGAGA